MQSVLDMLSSGVHDARNQLFIAESMLVQAETDHGVPLSEARFAIEQAASRLSRVLTAYKLQRHVGNLAIAMVSVGDLIQEAVLINGAHCRHLRVELTVDCPADLVWALDRELMLDVLSNAIQNASRFAKGAIHISAMREAERLTLRVDDDGPGFESTDLEVLAGKGVGLFVARELARLHRRGDMHGELKLSNGARLGGASFEIHLP